MQLNEHYLNVILSNIYFMATFSHWHAVLNHTWAANDPHLRAMLGQMHRLARRIFAYVTGA